MRENLYARKDKNPGVGHYYMIFFQSQMMGRDITKTERVK